MLLEICGKQLTHKMHTYFLIIVNLLNPDMQGKVSISRVQGEWGVFNAENTV